MSRRPNAPRPPQPSYLPPLQPMAAAPLPAPLPEPETPAPAATPAAEGKTPIVQATATRCFACQSTDRYGYYNVSAQEFGGVAPDGHPYTHIVRKWTRCRNCGQTRIDRVYENRAPAISPDE